MSEKAIVYTLPDCDVSERAMRDLRAEGIEVEERNVMRSKEWWDEALKYAITVPIILRDGKAQIGWKGAVG